MGLSDSGIEKDPAVDALRERVRDAADTGTSLRIVGGDSKSFYGGVLTGDAVSTRELSGVISYDPTELVVHVRAGTTLQELENTLAESGQMLPFEPPHFGESATVGGTVAAGISGPRRPFGGSVRDHVLGAGLINGRAEHLTFGGQVMKNVAGYDVSRLLTGSMGTLGIITDVSFKVLPLPVFEQTLVIEGLDRSEAIRRMATLMSTAAPLTAAAHVNSTLHLRLSGAEKAVSASTRQLGGAVMEDGDRFWLGLREHTLAQFDQTQTLWRLSLPPASQDLAIEGDDNAQWIIDWGGAQRWVSGSGLDVDAMRALGSRHGGHATAFRRAERREDAFTPLAAAVNKIQQNLKSAFDPHRIFNPGRLYPDI